MTKIDLITGKKLGFIVWYVCRSVNGQLVEVKSFMSEELARTEFKKLTNK